MSQIDVTIGVIVYNAELFIQEALNSCLEQLDDSINIELFISNDCSTDRTSELIEVWLAEHESKFTSCTFVDQEKNLGAKNNSNFVLNSSKGKYLRTLEGDDILVAGAIKKLYDFAESFEEIKFVFTNRLCFYDNVTEAFPGRSTSRKFAEANADLQYQMMLTGMEANGPTTFFHRETIIKAGGRVGARNAGDLTTLINLTRQGIKLYLYEESLLYYREHPSSISHSKGESWWKTKYELKQYRNNKLMRKDLNWKIKLYCYQDLLRAKRKCASLSWIEKFSLVLIRPIAKMMKKAGVLY
ncbi:glycosyltransferase family 2 protein [Lentisphaera marina]|uniref:glycosyltransferase family 2 protein n=1 Tax=Lentisphaera marina TaxID=1111041 RepID=UPI002365FF1B|nr:glycosyltransferase family 2 protein [Lentisphaera marina]MDD7985949.1 glycosyltransferase family 2 protein [Lentisphaera marina]